MTIVLFNYGRSSLRYLSAHPSFLPVWVDIRTQPFWPRQSASEGVRVVVVEMSSKLRRIEGLFSANRRTTPPKVAPSAAETAAVSPSPVRTTANRATTGVVKDAKQLEVDVQAAVRQVSEAQAAVEDAMLGALKAAESMEAGTQRKTAQQAVKAAAAELRSSFNLYERLEEEVAVVTKPGVDPSCCEQIAGCFLGCVGGIISLIARIFSALWSTLKAMQVPCTHTYAHASSARRGAPSLVRVPAILCTPEQKMAWHSMEWHVICRAMI